jgi:hypothetical protein
MNETYSMLTDLTNLQLLNVLYDLSLLHAVAAGQAHHAAAIFELVREADAVALLDLLPLPVPLEQHAHGSALAAGGEAGSRVDEGDAQRRVLLHQVVH